jgi:hypothetical protein
MFRYTSFLVILISILFFQSASAQKKAKVVVEKPTVSYSYDAGKGAFEYPWNGRPDRKEFVVWTVNEHGKFGAVSGIITPSTKITFINRKLKKEDLDLISGKEVVVFGKFRQEGEGEVIDIYCEELSIAIN